MNKERWEYLKKLKVPKPMTCWNAGKVIIGNIVMRPGTTYRKSERGPLPGHVLFKGKNGKLKNVYQSKENKSC